MKSTRILVTLAALLGFITPVRAQQDIQFSQYVFDGFVVNPAYAGYKGDVYANSTFRKQWVGVPGSPQTVFVAVDGLTRVSDDRVGIGGAIMWDKLGPQESLSFYGSYAYRIPLDETGERRLCLGLSGGVTQYALNGSLLTYTDPDDPGLPNIRVSTLVPDANFGVYYYTPKFYIGASVLDLFSINQSRDIFFSSGYSYASLAKHPHVYLTVGTMITLSQNVGLKPSVMIKEDFRGPTSVDLNLMALLADRVWVGGSYRLGVNSSYKSGYQSNLESNAAISVMAEYFATQSIRIGYAYDFTTNGMANYQNGSHEISIGILFPSRSSKERMQHPRYF